MSAETFEKYESVDAQGHAGQVENGSGTDPSSFRRFQAMVVVVAAYLVAITGIGLLVRW